MMVLACCGERPAAARRNYVTNGMPERSSATGMSIEAAQSLMALGGEYGRHCTGTAEMSRLDVADVPRARRWASARVGLLRAWPS